MSDHSIEIWARGGLGNQILEYLFGIASALDKGNTYKLHFSSRAPDERDNIFHKQGKVTVLDLFDIDSDISSEVIKKLCYWDENFIAKYFKYRSIILKDTCVQNLRLGIVVIKICRNSCAEPINVDEAYKLYDKLFYSAKIDGLLIKIITDDLQLSGELINRHRLPENCIHKGSMIEDWLQILFAEHVYSIYSTFSYCSLLINPYKHYTISSFEDSSNSYKHVENEFRVLCELQKYCPNLSFIQPQLQFGFKPQIFK